MQKKCNHSFTGRDMLCSKCHKYFPETNNEEVLDTQLAGLYNNTVRELNKRGWRLVENGWMYKDSGRTIGLEAAILNELSRPKE